MEIIDSLYRPHRADLAHFGDSGGIQENLAQLFEMASGTVGNRASAGANCGNCANVKVPQKLQELQKIEKPKKSSHRMDAAVSGQKLQKMQKIAVRSHFGCRGQTQSKDRLRPLDRSMFAPSTNLHPVTIPCTSRFSSSR